MIEKKTDTSSKPSILTMTSNDVGINYGPAVHYLELWNEVADLDPGLHIRGMAPSWSGAGPIIQPNFSLRNFRVYIPKIRQLLWDLICAGKILVAKEEVIYIRNSSMHLATLAALKIRQKKFLAVELNGLTIPDAQSRGSQNFFTAVSNFCEVNLIKRAQVIFSVTEKIGEYARTLNPTARHVHVENGVSKKFFSKRQEIDRKQGREIIGIYVGTFTAWDGASQIRTLARSRQDVRFLMIGDGGLRNTIEKDAPGNMEFVGRLPYRDLPEQYSRADFAIVLYEDERHKKLGSSPLKIREYLASRLPIFTSTASGTELVEDIDVGYRSKEGSVTDFNKFLSKIDHYRTTYSAVSHTLEEQHSWSTVARLTLDALTSEFRRHR
ncbi:glycosyltransferase [Notoacmeibacter marinus]|uniref:glycosyltransferase n=1 Tax=Notoacmeibacter marinus TaxID=1876515 RepID=UPI000DF186B4|nr:glycosyltransferase [Notoacmeibacter marinus]